MTRVRRGGLLLWLLVLVAGALFTGLHVGIDYALTQRFELRVLLVDLGLVALGLAVAAWYIRSVTAERQRHAAQLVLLDVLSEPRNIGDAARGVLLALTRHGLADAGIVALADEQGEAHRVLAAIGYPEGWAKSASQVRYAGTAEPIIRRDREPHPWAAPITERLGKRPWTAHIPISSNGDVIGLLLLVSRKGGPLRDPAVLATIGRQVGAALDHAALYEASYQRERDLEGQDQRRRDFMGAISHEIRTPLMSIQAFADLLRMDRGSMDSAADELVSSLTFGVDRLNRLVTDLIDLGRSGGQELEVNVTEMDAVQSLRMAESLMRPALLLREQTVLADLPAEPLMAIADPHRLEQVVLALLSNANRHAPPASAIELHALRTEEGRIRLEIRDHGIGIAREDRERIFELYYRVRGPGGESVPGSGLGLAVARRLIEAQGGRVWVEDPEDGPGARFCIEVRAAYERP